ncbi:MAG: metallophosphoesterase [Tannerella sp.]|nr:metallophosphoesterase [Tannerella sp.]
MNEILIVPDIHGRNFWEPALDYDGEVIFLGDYTDPYPHEHFTSEDAYRNLLKIISYKQQNPDRVTLLTGNHELHYYNREFAASRFSSKYYEKYHAILTDDATAGLFQICKQIDKYLFIHAGITKSWYDLHKDELQRLGTHLEDQVNNLFTSNMEAFFEISGYRGGFHRAGSPLWADIHELFGEEESFDHEMIQVIGHTQIADDEPFIEGNIRLLDNRQLYVLKAHEIKKYT